MRCANCRSHIPFFQAYARAIICRHCGARLTVRNLNWLIAANVVMLIGMLVLGFFLSHPLLHVAAIIVLAMLFYLIFDHWVLRTTSRVDYYNLTMRR